MHLFKMEIRCFKEVIVLKSTLNVSVYYALITKIHKRLNLHNILNVMQIQVLNEFL